jgi:hypothetical protein
LWGCALRLWKGFSVIENYPQKALENFKGLSSAAFQDTNDFAIFLLPFVLDYFS